MDFTETSTPRERVNNPCNANSGLIWSTTNEIVWDPSLNITHCCHGIREKCECMQRVCVSVCDCWLVWESDAWSVVKHQFNSPICTRGLSKSNMLEIWKGTERLEIERKIEREMEGEIHHLWYLTAYLPQNLLLQDFQHTLDTWIEAISASAYHARVWANSNKMYKV